LSTAQIAAVLLTTESAMAKRLTRTRQKIAAAHIPYRVPAPAELPNRLTAVCSVIHALYTTGHAPITGAAVVNIDVCAEAIRLGRLVVDLLPDESQPTALLALLLLTDARSPARVDDAGDVVLLADQDRSRWDREQIVEGCALLDSSLRRTSGIADSYQLQAAIAAEHARAPSYARTDWQEIVRLYDLLLSVAPNAAVALNRAVAVAEANGAAAGLAALANVAPSSRWHAVRGELLAREGRYAEAVEATTAALDSELTAPERRYRELCIAEWTAKV
jgi:RNA polymerase sigma-70 factor (ECF subfamily)